MATHDRAQLLRQTLEYFCQLECGAVTWELLLVANASGEATARTLEWASRKTTLPIVPLSEPRPGKGRAVNRALEHVSGELIVFTDDDIVPQSDWLTRLWEATWRWRGNYVFGGRVIPRFPPNTPAWIRDPRNIDHGTVFAAYDPAAREGVVQARPVGPNMAISRAVLGADRIREDLGPTGINYHASGDESELVSRLMARGAQVVYVPDAVVEHVVRAEQLTLEALWKRAEAFGRGSALLNKDRQPWPRIAGVAVKYWWSALRAGLRHAMLRFAAEKRRFTPGWKWHFRRARVLQYRHMAARKRGAG